MISPNWFVSVLSAQHKDLDVELDYSLGQELWSHRDLDTIDREDWILRNWNSEWEHTLRCPERMHLCRTALRGDSPILELAAGASGGNLSPLMHLSKERHIIVNDIEPRILKRWHKFLVSRELREDIALASFDACSIPLLDQSVGCISSRGGISSCCGDSSAVLSECARVLKPGGVMVLYEMCLSERTVANLPPALREAWAYNPWLYGEWSALLAAHHFLVQRDVISERMVLDPKTSALAIDAALFGAELEAVFRAVVAVRL